MPIRLSVNVGERRRFTTACSGFAASRSLFSLRNAASTGREPRQSGFLIPNLGNSSVKGTILGESLFWAINRSTDAHLVRNIFLPRGWAPQGEFRAQPGQNSFVDINYFGVLDRGVGNRSGGIRVVKRHRLER